MCLILYIEIKWLHLKKTAKFFFCGKKWAPNHWISSRKKSSKSSEKNSSSLFVQIWSSKRCVEFFKINGSWDIYVSVILRSPKIVLYNKIVNETWSTKNQKNSAHCFADNYLSNHLVKFLQDRIKPWRVGALRVCTAYNCF